jgi:hypothetical protein
MYGLIEKGQLKLLIRCYNGEDICMFTIMYPSNLSIDLWKAIAYLFTFQENKTIRYLKV